MIERACGTALLALGLVLLQPGGLRAQGEIDAAWIQQEYSKQEVQIPMRDGARLFTAIFRPRDHSKPYPILLKRTPYGLRPYGPDAYPAELGPSGWLARDRYIFVYQDVRGKYLSEGEFDNMRPHRPRKESAATIDESSDTYDTIEWLVREVEGNSGRVGMWGISYPGFYAAAGMIDAHPALKAVSPQAPIADWWYDDFHHHGAFFLPHCFNFIARFGVPRPEPTTASAPRFQHGTNDGYQFFLDLGSLARVEEAIFQGRIPFWTQLTEHPNYDQFWQERNLLPHLSRVAPAVMTVGGWFDAEDLYGPLQIYRSIEQRNPGIFNILVMGPWAHGGWARTTGAGLGDISFGAPTATKYQEEVERPFFRFHLKGEGELDLPEALVFETGRNRWRSFDQWPPAELETVRLYCRAGGRLAREAPSEPEGAADRYLSDPARPVPFSQQISVHMVREYMIEDQRFAARRPDVLVYQTPVLAEPVTVAGPVQAHLWVSTEETDADWIVKLIDVFPAAAGGEEEAAALGGYQMLVRSEVLRGRFRNEPARPEPFVSGEVTPLQLPLQDLLHTFLPGHRIMIQVQSTWFPLVDRNPQKYVDNIYRAKEEDFVAAWHRLHRSAEDPSHIEFGQLIPASGE